MKIALVSCVSQKLPHAAPACELYTSTWFKKAVAYAEQEADQYAILSARYGLLLPGWPVVPYDLTLNQLDAASRKYWASKVATQIEALTEGKQHHFIFLAGKNYRQHLAAMLVDAGHQVTTPMAALGIGQQLQFLTRAIYL